MPENNQGTKSLERSPTSENIYRRVEVDDIPEWECITAQMVLDSIERIRKREERDEK